MKREDIEKAAAIYTAQAEDSDYAEVRDVKQAFVSGAEWMEKHFSWISVEERLPEEGQRILVEFLFYYKYHDREAQSRRYIDTFTYKYGVWVGDNGESYPGKELTRRDIKVICWQPIPSFDEILEANRDVLERIKEKGD
jgi:hypothetical protein